MERAAGTVPRGRHGEGYVTSITDFGVFVEIEEGIEGLIHLSEIENGKGKHPSELFKIDDLVKAMVINVDEKDKRIGLSTKALKKAEEKKRRQTPSPRRRRAPFRPSETFSSRP